MTNVLDLAPPEMPAGIVGFGYLECREKFKRWMFRLTMIKVELSLT